MDLTQLTPSFPARLDREVPRDNLVNQLARSFGPNCQKQGVIGVPKSGKTNLLAQFARQYPGQCVSYFVNEDPWTQRQHGFLLAICNQLSELLEKSVDLTQAETDDLKNLLTALVTDLNRRARQSTHEKYYFVIDGIEWAIAGTTGERIVDVLPRTYPAGPFLLFSCRQLEFRHIPDYVKSDKNVEPLAFSVNETRGLLENQGYSDEEIVRIHRQHDGNPGSLYAVYNAKRINPGFSVQAAMQEYERVVLEQVRHFLEGASAETRIVLNYLAVCPTGLPIEVIAGLTGSSIDDLAETLRTTTFPIYVLHDDRLEFQSKVYRDSYLSLLVGSVEDYSKELIGYIETSHPSQEFLLTSLYIESGDYEGLQKQLVPTSVLDTVSNPAHGVSGILQRLRSVSEIAANRGDNIGLLKWCLGTAAIKSYVDHSINYGEIRALIAIGEESKAIKKAYQIKDKPNQVRFLAQVYATMEMRGDRVSHEAKQELEALVTSLKVQEIDEEVIQELAEDIFPLLPEESVALVESVAPRGDEAKAIGLFTKAVTTRDQGGTVSDERSGADTSNRRLSMGRLGLRWLESKTILELETDIEGMSSTLAKEQLVREWSRVNKKDPGLYQAMTMWVELVKNDPEFILTLRALRQISALLEHLRPGQRDDLAAELRTIGYSVLDSPKQEWIKFQLNLCEAVAESDPEESLRGISQLIEEVLSEPLDLDVKTFCLARINSTLNRFFPAENDVKERVSTEFHEAFYTLLGNSAEQYEIISDTLGALIEVDPEAALVVALELNIKERRQNALAHIFRVTLIRRGEEDVAGYLSQIADQLFEQWDPLSFVRLLSELRMRTVQLSSENLEFLTNLSASLGDPARQALAFANLSALSPDTKRKSELAELATTAWESEDDIGIRISAGYVLVDLLADTDKELATRLYETIQENCSLPGAYLAIGSLEEEYFRTIQLAIRALTGMQNTPLLSHVYEIENWIEKIPSKYIKGSLYAELASSAYRMDLHDEAERIIRSRLLTIENELSSPFLQRKLILGSFPVLFEYDPEEAERLSASLQESERETAWTLALLWTLSRSILRDLPLIEGDKLKVMADRPRIKRAIEIAKKLKFDVNIYPAIIAITSVLEHSYGNDRLSYVQVLELLQELDDWVGDALPDQVNIPHEGFLILARADIHRVRSVAFKSRGRDQSASGLSGPKISKAWQDLVSRGEQISNIADRVFIMAHLAQKLKDYHKDSNYVRQILEKAQADLRHIPALLDRLERLEVIAKAWHYLGEKSSAEIAIGEAIDLARQFEGRNRDQILRAIVQTSYAIGDGKLASEMVSRLDVPTSSFGMLGVPQRTMKIEELRKRPTNLPELWQTTNLLHEHEAILSESAKKLLGDLITARGRIDHPDVLAQWLLHSRNYRSDVVFLVASWVVENWARSNRIQDLAVFDSAIDLNQRLAREAYSIGRREISGSIADSLAGLSSRYEIFEVGQTEAAQEWLSKWLETHVKGYVKICDPYFGLSELGYLSRLPPNTVVLIVTTSSKIGETTTEDVERKWQDLSSRALPYTQFIVVPTDSYGRFHDRVIITESGGLDLGGSLNGFGKTRQKVALLSAEEAKELETKYLADMLDSTVWLIKRGVRPRIFDVGGTG